MSDQDLSTQILSDITVYMKYAKYVPMKKRREEGLAFYAFYAVWWQTY